MQLAVNCSLLAAQNQWFSVQ